MLLSIPGVEVLAATVKCSAHGHCSAKKKFLIRVSCQHCICAMVVERLILCWVPCVNDLRSLPAANHRVWPSPLHIDLSVDRRIEVNCLHPDNACCHSLVECPGVSSIVAHMVVTTIQGITLEFKVWPEQMMLDKCLVIDVYHLRIHEAVLYQQDNTGSVVSHTGAAQGNGTKVFAPGRPPGYPRGRQPDVRNQNLLFGLLFRS